MVNGQKTRKKPNKKQVIEDLKRNVDNNLKNEYIKGLIGGRNFFAQLVFDSINNGYDLDEIKHLCEIIIDDKSTEPTMNVVNNNNNEIKEIKE